MSILGTMTRTVDSLVLASNNLVIVSSTLDSAFLLATHQFNVARGAQVSVDTTMGTVGAATHLRGLINLDVLDDNLVQGESLALSITLGILEETQEEMATLLGPSSLRHTPNLSLSTTTNSTAEAAERYGLLVLHDVLQEALGLEELHALDGHSRLMGVLEMNT